MRKHAARRYTQSALVTAFLAESFVLVLLLAGNGWLQSPAQVLPPPDRSISFVNSLQYIRFNAVDRSFQVAVQVKLDGDRDQANVPITAQFNPAKMTFLPSRSHPSCVTEKRGTVRCTLGVLPRYRSVGLPLSFEVRGEGVCLREQLTLTATIEPDEREIEVDNNTRSWYSKVDRNCPAEGAAPPAHPAAPNRPLRPRNS